MQLGSGIFVRTILSLDFISKPLPVHRVCGVCLNLSLNKDKCSAACVYVCVLIVQTFPSWNTEQMLKMKQLCDSH